jgi:adenosyl cobinamide kinase/adenosyl cobinamide phosphate guanylyltransferase
MSTETISANLDVEALFTCIAAGRPIDPDLAKRVREHSEQLREEVRGKSGLLDLAVDLIREIRDEE